MSHSKSKKRMQRPVRKQPTGKLETLVILDFGSQYTQLIARRLREKGVYTEIYPASITAKELAAPHIRGVILSGASAELRRSKSGPCLEARPDSSLLSFRE